MREYKRVKTTKVPVRSSGALRKRSDKLKFIGTQTGGLIHSRYAFCTSPASLISMFCVTVSIPQFGLKNRGFSMPEIPFPFHVVRHDNRSRFIYFEDRHAAMGLLGYRERPGLLHRCADHYGNIVAETPH